MDMCLLFLMVLCCIHFLVIKVFLVDIMESLFCLSLHVTLTYAALIVNQMTSKLRELK